MRPVVLSILICFSGWGHAAPPAQSAETYTVECVFSNPAYSGRCTVEEQTTRDVKPKAACEAILSCLNDARCVTKTYCNATELRGGWKLEESREKK